MTARREEHGAGASHKAGAYYFLWANIVLTVLSMFTVWNPVFYVLCVEPCDVCSHYKRCVLCSLCNPCGYVTCVSVFSGRTVLLLATNVI